MTVVISMYDFCFRKTYDVVFVMVQNFLDRKKGLSD